MPPVERRVLQTEQDKALGWLSVGTTTLTVFNATVMLLFKEHFLRVRGEVVKRVLSQATLLRKTTIAMASSSRSFINPKTSRKSTPRIGPLDSDGNCLESTHSIVILPSAGQLLQQMQDGPSWPQDSGVRAAISPGTWAQTQDLVPRSFAMC